MRSTRPLRGSFSCVAIVVMLAACQGGGGQAELTEEVTYSAVRGLAHGGDPGTPPASYEFPAGAVADGVEDAMWAEDGPTLAYSHPPTGGRVSGGVRAEAADTVAGDGMGEAEARSESRVTTTLSVLRSGRFAFQVRLALHDIELANSATAWAAVRAGVVDAEGEPVDDGRIGELVVELRPDGSVVLDGVGEAVDALDPAGAYTTTLTGPAGGIRLAAGRYLVELELTLLATAPLHQGPNQVAAIGDGSATVRLR